MIYSLLLSSLFHAVSASCPDLASLRSSLISTNYTAQLIEGFWYEVAYQDLAQVGETCQYYDKTLASNKIDLTEKFGFTYSSPRHMNLYYAATDVLGFYNKHTGTSEILKAQDDGDIPIVIMDALLNSDGSYRAVSEYACFQVGPIVYQEIRVGSRTPTLSSEDIAQLTKPLDDAGVKYTLKNVEHTSECEYA